MIYKNFYNKYKMSKEEINEDEVILKLGDVILIVDDTNEILNNNVFMIEYIDDSKIKLINSETFEKDVLNITSDGIIGNGDIQGIKVLSSNPENGYARQNNLLPGTWINIYFGGEIPVVVTGKITNLEEDMIEIRTTDEDTIYINFEYKGVPEDLMIETFEIRSAIQDNVETKEEEMNEEPNQDREDGEITDDEDYEEDYEVDKIPKAMVEQKIKKMLFDMNDIEFGDVINVEEYITIDKDKYRFNVETQANDLLEEMISTIPNHKRTNSVLNNIHIMISRFLQLREISSTFDANKNIDGIIKRTADDRPLANYLSEFKNTLYWIMIVAKNIKKIYSKKTEDVGDDYEEIDINTELTEFASLYETRQSARQIKKNYSNFTYKSSHHLSVPFNNVLPNPTNDVFSNPNGIIVDGSVNGNLNVIIDNLGDLYSTVVDNSGKTNRRFVIQRYNLSDDKLKALNFKGQHLITHRVKVFPNDPLSINSIMTLPEPAVRFSQINLPGSNLLVRANLNMEFLNYWQLLKQQTQLTKVTIDGLDNEIEYDDSNFVDNIKQYLLDLSEYNRPQNISNMDIYKIFLKTIIPKIKVLFSLVKKYIKGKLSFIDVVNYLEPFMIYPIDLTYMQYNDINKFIYEKIKEYNVKFKEYSMTFSSMRYIKHQGRSLPEIYNFKNPLFDVLEDKNDLNLKYQTLGSYGYSVHEGFQIGGSEFLKNIILEDYGNLFNSSVALTNISLMFPKGLNELFSRDKDQIKIIIDKERQTDKCSSFIIAKKYYSNESLISDNNKQIYYDKEFDTTNYDLIDEKYKKYKNQMSSEDFILFLTEEFKKQNKMNEVSAEYLATTLVNQSKRVREGDYAILVTSEETMGEKVADDLQYYVRNLDTWVLEKDIDSKTFIKDDDILCNIDYNCMYNSLEKGEQKCESTEISKNSIIKKTLNDIIEQFDKKYEVSQDELNVQINKKLLYAKRCFDNLQEVKKLKHYKNNNFQYNLGLTVEDDNIKIKTSPYVGLKNLILGQNDFIKRQHDIVSFVTKYCYQGNPETPNINDGEMENEWWLYCDNTNTKLMPSFYYMLATTFINNNSKYDDVLTELKRTIGKRSDDGDSWVDENSGEVICYIDMDTSEGYNDGFVDRSRDIIERDAGDIMIDDEKNKKNKRFSREGEIVSNIVSVLSSNMGIDIEHLREYIISVVSELMSDPKIIVKESAYKKIEEEAAKKRKKAPSYASVYSRTILYLTMGMYLIAIQTSVPPIRSRKTVPGCVRSFTGFPFEGEGDESSLNYVVCTALKSRDTTTAPWNAMPNNEENVQTSLKNFIIRYLLTYPEVEHKIRDKIEYLLINPQTYIPDEHNLAKWNTFLPPLNRFKVKNLQNVTDGFLEELQNDLIRGKTKQQEKILVIQSKIIQFSFAIQESIQKIVEKKALLMKTGNNFFMDNACCNEPNVSIITTLQYFINEDKNIESYNMILYSLSALLDDIKTLTQAPLLLSEINSKRIFPEIINEISEETIYTTFISLCNFQSTSPLSEELGVICIDKPDYLKKMDTIQEKIERLKRDGRKYTKEQFTRLFQIASRNNMIKVKLDEPTLNCFDHFKILLENIEKENKYLVPDVLIQHLKINLENYDVLIEKDTENMRSLKNYLQSNIETMSENLIDFIKYKGKLTSLELKNMTTFIRNISIWRFNENPRNIDIKITDDELDKYVNFIKNSIDLIVNVFPSMIINQNNISITPPIYWKLTESHVSDIKTSVNEFYKPIEKYYGNDYVSRSLQEINKKNKDIFLLSQNTPITSSIKMGDKELFNVFDKRTITLLYEFYFLSVLNEYVLLMDDTTIINDILNNDNLGELSLFTSSEFAFIEPNFNKLNTDIARLVFSYLTIMSKSKKVVNVSYTYIQDKVFKSREAEKYDFTDKLRDMTDEERTVDTILKIYKLGPIYSLGMSKGIKEYDADHFEHDKKIAENVSRIQNNNRSMGSQGAVELDDAIDEMLEQEHIDLDNAINRNQNEDYNDGGDDDYDDYGYDYD